MRDSTEPTINQNAAQFFPDALIALNKEVAENHPKVMTKINLFAMENGRTVEITEALGIIASHVGFVLDGHYQIQALSELLLKELKASRMIILTTH